MLLGLLMVVTTGLLPLLVVVATRLWLFDLVLVIVSIDGHWGGCCWVGVGVGFSFGGSSGDGFGCELEWWV